jgi:high affinity Mn2+ porin
MLSSCRNNWSLAVLCAAIFTLGVILRAEEPLPITTTQSALSVLKPTDPGTAAPLDSKAVDQAMDTKGDAKGDEKGDAKSDQLFTFHHHPSEGGEQLWNFHMQNTDIVQADPGFHAKYSGVNSLKSKGELQETVTLDLFGGVRLWHGAEIHADGLMWQGFGLSKSFGIEDFPNGDAFKAGTEVPNFSFARMFVRQTIGLGGEQEDIPDDQLTLPGKQDISRLTFTFGRFTPEDIVDNNAYAHDQHAQFMSWGLMANPTFDYGQDTIGFTTGLAAELNQKNWSLRYTFFQMPRDKNGYTADDQIFTYPQRGEVGPFSKSWAMAAEFERRYNVGTHPGAIRFMPWLDEAHFASYDAATAILFANGPKASVEPARAYRHKYGFGLSWDQEIVKNIGVFARLGWNDGHNESWTFTDLNSSASLGVSVKGAAWKRPDDTVGFAGMVGGASRNNQKFLEAGGAELLDGDGKLSYRPEKALETYYDFKLWKSFHGTLDYQFVADPAFNRDRGPVSIFGARLHWGF